MKNNFLWGASSSSYQSEGTWKNDGKGESIIENNHPLFHQGVDFYHHYKEDIHYMKIAGLKAFRFSISWTRIFLNGTGEPNKKGVQFYQNVLSELKKNQIEPIVTIYHFDHPTALIKKYGGWLSRQSIRDYLSYL